MRVAPLTAALLWATAVFASQNPDLGRTIESIQAAIQKGDHAGASRQLDDALARFPAAAGLINLRGVLHGMRSEVEQARADFEQAVKLAPSLIPAWQNLARACQMGTDRDSTATACAVHAWQRVLAARPSDTEARTSLATLYEWQGKFGESLQELEKLPRAEAARPEMLALRCADLAGLHRTREAEDVAVRLVRAPGFSEADVISILPVLESKANAQLAVTLIEAADAKTPASIASLRRLAIAYEQLDRLADARKTLERVAAQDRSNPQHLYELARVAYLSRDLEGCLGYLAHVRDLTPNDPRVHFLFGLVTSQMKLPLEAKKSLEKALALDPQNPDYNYSMGTTLLAMGEHAAAAGYFEKTVAARPNDVRAHFALGVAYFASGNYDQCRAEMLRVSKDPKTQAGAAYFLGRIARVEGNYAEAAAQIERSLKLEPSFAESYTELARIRLRQDQNEAARKAVERALALDPDNFQANSTLLALYQRTHDPRAKEQAVRLRTLDEKQSKQLELMLRTIELRPY
ncbi:MAG TPA: tetratricopeptide repeat protein [Bryobacteraceae bacterium]|nr:tetratricopeptide repeat protein [Bryobacteraceae bacterium]